MDYMINPGNVNNVPADTYLAHENDVQEYVFLILKGKLSLENGACSITCGTGAFVGLNDCGSGRYSSSVYAKEEASVYAFPVKSTDSPLQVLKAKKEYSGIAVWSLARAIYDYDRLEQELEVKATDISNRVREYRDEYGRVSKLAGFLGEFKLADRMKDYEAVELSDSTGLSYYLEIVRQPIDNSKLFFADAPVMTERHINEEAALIKEMQARCVATASFIEEAVYVLFNCSKENLYMKTAELMRSQKSLGKDTSSTEALLDRIKDAILDAVIFFEQNMHYPLKVNIERMEAAYMGVLNGDTAEIAESGSLDTEAVSILRKSLADGPKVLTDFAGWEKDKADAFIESIDKFVATANKMSSDETLRALKRSISKQFTELYMDVFLKQADTKATPQIVDLFLDFGFVDERLLGDEKLTDLCTVKPDKPTAPCQVYTFREWLTLIYKMRRVPSRSELDMDFEEYLRDLKKRGEVTDAKMAEMAKDPFEWVSYEIHNMFATNERLLNGQVTTFVPVLYDEGIAGLPSRQKITKDRINTLVALLTVNDPSLFHREIIHNDAAAKIEREPIMRQVYPEFILFPVNGSNIVMWQETSSRKRDSAGRILLPTFFEGSAEDAMLRAFGRFRWELCKTVMGLSWNNIQVKSLTSEYYDYITYYRKNHDLSEERKEKIKSQLTRGRNNIREVFVQDYESWIKYEANGAVRLNKVARELLATYIPFSKTTRTGLEAQPVFADAYGRFERNLKKKIYDIDLHYKNLEKNGTVITDDLKKNKEFYNKI